MALKLTLPVVAHQLDRSLEIRPVYIEEWVEDLPLAGPDVLSNRVLLAVSRLNRNPVKPKLRLELMEHYAGAYQALLNVEEDQPPAKTISERGKQRNSSEVAGNLAIELSYGYKQIIADLIGKSSGRRLMAVAVQRAMLFNLFVIIYDFDQYRSFHQALWEELWSLFHFAKRQKFETARARRCRLYNVSEESIAQLFKRALLARLVDPYHLPEHMIWRTFEWLGELAEKAELRPIEERVTQPGVFVVESNREPTTADCFEGGISDNSEYPPLVLDTHGVIGYLIGLQSGEALKDSRLVDVVKLIIRSLELPPKRRMPRTPTTGEVQLTSGMSMLYCYLSETFETFQFESDSDGIEIVDTLNTMEKTAPKYEIDTWSLVDRGPGGVCIRTSDPHLLVGVGELLGVHYADDPTGRWGLGLARWMKVRDDGEHLVGVQILSECVRPLTIEGDGMSTSASSFIGFALENQAGSEDPTLVTARGCCTQGARLCATTIQNRFHLDVGPMVDCTARYEQHHYKLAGRGPY